MTIAQQLAEHITTPHVIDDELGALIDTFITDAVGVTVAGAEQDSAVAARRASALADTADDLRTSRIHGRDLWATLEEAALVNGVAAHGPELDDTHEQASMHPAVVVMPAVFAYADAHPVTAAQARLAIAVGYDAMTSIGTLLGAAESYGRGFHPTAVCGPVGAAAAVAVLMGLSREEAAHAVSLAANLAAGSLEFLSDGSWTKRLNPGHASATGIRAARFAQAGFQGPALAFEGRDGFLRQYGQGVVDGRELELEFGRGVRDTSIKIYPCCRYMHGNIDLLRELHTEFPDLALDDVEAIECGVISAGATLISDPPERKLVVTTPIDAQFNMPFGAAVALTTGEASVEHFQNAVEVAQRLDGWMRKVVCSESPQLEAAFPEAWQAEVRLRLTDGRVIERFAEAYLGSPGKRMSRDEIVSKLAGLVGRERAESISARVAALAPSDRFSSEAVLGA